MTATLVRNREVVVPTDAEKVQAAEASLTLAAWTDSSGSELTVSVGQDREPILLPASAVRLLLTLLTELGFGNAVVLDSVPPELFTYRAAELLDLPHVSLLRLLDDGVLSFRTEGDHRRVRRADVLAYKQQRDAQRHSALAELTTRSQEMDESK